MTLIILPNYISDEIDRRIDAAIAETPDAAADRELFRESLIAHFAQTGQVASFTLVKADRALPLNAEGGDK